MTKPGFRNSGSLVLICILCEGPGADLLRLRRQFHVGDEMPLTLWRDGELMEVTLVLQAKETAVEPIS